MDQFPSSPHQSTLTQNDFQLDNGSTRYKTELELKQFALNSLRESSSNTLIIPRHVRAQVPHPTLANMFELTTDVPPMDASDDNDFETPTNKYPIKGNLHQLEYYCSKLAFIKEISTVGI